MSQRDDDGAYCSGVGRLVRNAAEARPKQNAIGPLFRFTRRCIVHASEGEMRQLTRVVYITGSGRSGSTLLNALLGSSINAISVGELARLPSSGWINGEYCACGETVNNCPFWRDVKKRWVEKTGSSPQAFVSAQLGIEKSRYLYRSLRGASSAKFALYEVLIRALFDSIVEVSEKEIIVDATKNPVRAIALTRIPGLDTRLIHLVRDARGVAWSLMKQYSQDSRAGIHQTIVRQSPVKSLARWSLVNILSEFALYLGRPNGVRVRYEDLTTAPDGALQALGDALDIPIESAVSEAADARPVRFGHMVAGNRIRMRDNISIQPDIEWRERMERSEQRKLWRLAWPLMRRYDYAR